MSRCYDPKNKKNKRQLLKKLCPIAAVLLIAAVGTAVLTATPFAKYISSVNSEESSATVAGFAVSTTNSGSKAIEFKGGAQKTQDTYSFTVSNVAENGFVNEVSTSYDIEVVFPSEVKGINMTISDGTNEVSGTTADNITYTFSDVGTFEKGTAQTDNLTLTFNFDEDNAEAGTWEGIKINVNATQED